MPQAKFDVVGIGNAIVDVIAQADDAFLSKNSLNKGTMTLIDAAQADALYAAMGPAVEVSGGSAANTIAGIASKFNLTKKRVREVRAQGVTGFLAQEWTFMITGQWPA